MRVDRRVLAPFMVLAAIAACAMAPPTPVPSPRPTLEAAPLFPTPAAAHRHRLRRCRRSRLLRRSPPRELVPDAT